MKTAHLLGLAALLGLALSACKTQHDCEDGSVYVRLMCDETPAGTNEIVLAVSDANGGDMHIFSSCADKPSLEVKLTKYAANTELLASVTFRTDGKEIAKPIKRNIVLKAGCTPYDFQIAATEVELVDEIDHKPDAGGPVDEDGGTTEMPGDAGDIPAAGLGSACVKTEDCTGGAVCVSNVCCNSKCDGTCESCLAKETGGADGFCKAASLGKDPKNACVAKPAEPCGPAGSCDGQGKCSLAQPGTSCGSAMCGAAGQVVSGGTCDGKGVCGTGAASSCSGYACKSGSCATGCTGDGDCVGVKCINGKCGGKRALGDACADGTECGSGSCVQNICCDGACTDNCKSCKMALTGQANGKCSFVKAGEAAAACPADGAMGCGNDGTCDGQGGCRKRNASTVCGAAICTGTTYQSQRSCDGAGTCKVATQTNCGLYSCAASGCKQPCGTDSDCVSGHYCNGGACVPAKAKGDACTTSAQCQTGFCAPEGICCNEACNGVCKQCATGTCINAQGREDADTCKGDRTCNTQAVCVGKMGAKCSSKAECDYPYCDQFYPDADGDGYGDLQKPQRFCLANQGSNFHDPPPPGYVINSADCCDVDAKSPNFSDDSAPNLCGSWDLNCDGQVSYSVRECQHMCTSSTSTDAYSCFDFSTDSRTCGAATVNNSCVYGMLYYMGQGKAACR